MQKADEVVEHGEQNDENVGFVLLELRLVPVFWMFF